MAIQTSAGSRIYIGDALPATFDAVGYAAVSYTDIGAVENIGAFGAEDALVTFTPVGDRTQRKFKGSRNLGSLAATAALDNGDAGQDLVRSQSELLDATSFKVELPTGDIYYFSALVMNNPVEIGSTDQVTMSSFNLELTAGPLGEGIIYVPVP